MEARVVVGIDPGVRETGVAVWYRAQNALHVVGLSGRDPRALVAQVVDLPLLFKVDHSIVAGLPLFAIEEQRFVQSGKTEEGQTSFAASAVRDLQMVLAGAAYALGWPVVFVHPATAKAAVVGGRAKKGQVVKAVEARFKLKVSSNQADAVAIALAGESAYRMTAFAFESRLRAQKLMEQSS
jgi:Holliday junction resolvasome RuvABC endonuclease subunit